MRSQAKVRRNRRERGSALLVVLVFAAIVAIVLYKEIPSVLFEARRQKEELLVDRGHEYVRAIQLYYRRNHGQFPSSIQQLESTNNIRYLRKKYTDPFTGKDDWRLLHAGPGGMLIDSKVNRLATATGIPGMGAAQPQANGTGNPPSSGSNSFGTTGFSTAKDFSNEKTDSFGSDSTAVVIPDLVKRPPAMRASGSADHADAQGLEQPPSSAQLDQNPDTPLLPAAGLNGSGLPAMNSPEGTSTATLSAGTAGTNGQQGTNVMQTMAPVLSNPTTSASSANAFGTQGGQQAASGNSSSGFGGGGASGFGSSTSGQLNGGGSLAGVASKAKGHSIKLVADQDDYSLWEFYYDPTKDTGLSAGATGGATGSNMPSSGNPGQQTTPNSGAGNASQSGFGSNTSSFGSTSGFGSASGFGSNSQAGSSSFGSSQSGFGSTNNGGATQQTGTAPPTSPNNSTNATQTAPQ